MILVSVLSSDAWALFILTTLSAVVFLPMLTVSLADCSHMKDTGGSDGKECLLCGRLEFDPQVKKIPWRRKWQPLQYSRLENPMDRGASWTTVHGVILGSTAGRTSAKTWPAFGFTRRDRLRLLTLKCKHPLLERSRNPISGKVRGEWTEIPSFNNQGLGRGEQPTFLK